MVENHLNNNRILRIETKLLYMKQKTYNGLPLYGADVVSDESGMAVISLVDDPAIQIPFMTFKGQSEFKFNISDEDKRLVYGPVMLADTPIYRNQNNM